MTRALFAVAAVAATPWLAAHALGWRESVSALVMTGGDPVRGGLYIVGWLAFVTVTPAATIAALVHATLQAWPIRST